MGIPRRKGVLTALVMVALLVAAGALTVGGSTAGARLAPSLSSSKFAAHLGSGALSAAKVRDMRQVPKATRSQLATKQRPMPRLLGMSPARYAALKEAAKTSSAAPRYTGARALPSGPAKPSSVHTPGGAITWNGLSNSAATCPYLGGCQPSDMAIAAGAGKVLQGVNTSFALYDAAGTLQAGWPKTAQAFFGIPNVSGCDPAHGNQPFTSDPRAIFDPNTGRFFAAILQVEGAFGVAPACPHKTGYWIAVSKTNDPAGAWWIYFLNLEPLAGVGAGNAVDFTMIGLSPKSLTVGGNVFNNAGTAFTNNFMLSLNKSRLMNGLSLRFNYFFAVTFGGVLMDTIHPVVEFGRRIGPVADLFAASFNLNFGGGACSSGCSGIAILAIGNPRGEQSSGAVFSGAVASGLTYSLPPNAPDGSAADTVQTNDPRIASAPVYQNGTVWGTLNTGFNTGTSIVPAAYWFQAHPVLNHGAGACTLCVSITSAGMVQNNYYAYVDGTGVYYGSVVPDTEGNVFLGANYSNTTGVSPSTFYVSRRATEALNAFSDNGLFIQFSATTTSNFRWGDYSAASWDGFSADRVFLAGQYSNGTWATSIARVAYTLAATA